ncbi:MAG TPA: hypothetical protein VFC46_11020, partial [Humisphaera sp.]|nr:hypothetical protein [Humisphaera sp.]
MSPSSPIDYKSPPTPAPRPAASRRPTRFPSRRPTAIVLIVSLILAGVLRQFAATEQLAFSKTRGRAESRSTFGNMDSFALALL